MADVEFSIEVQAEGVGTDATAEQLGELGDSIEAAEKVLTPFDSALEQTASLLDKAAQAAETANSALSSAEAEYKRLERAATRSGKAVERAAAKGKDTAKLQAAADAAAAAVKRQGVAVDQARAKATAATAAENRLAATYKKISVAAGAAAAKTKALGRAQSAADKSSLKLGSTIQSASPLMGAFGGRVGQVTTLLGQTGWVGAVILAALAATLLAAALVVLTAKMLQFAVAADKATSKKLEAAWKRASKNAKALFEGVRTDKLVKPVNSLLKLLDKNTSAGKGLAKIFETILNPIIDGLVKAEPLAKEFLKGMLLGALKLIIIFLRLRNAIVKAIPKETREKIKRVIASIVGLESAAKAGEVAFFALAIALGIVAAAMLIVAAAIVLLTALFLAIPIAIGLITAKLFGFFDEAPDKAKKGGKEAGEGFGEGMVDGIGAMIGKVVAKAAEMGNKAVEAIKAALKSKSPSVRLFDVGFVGVGGGLVLGMEKAIPKVLSTSRKMGEASEEGVREGSKNGRPAPELKRRSGQQQTGQGSVGGRQGQATITVQFGEGAIVINGGSGDDESMMRAARKVFLEEIDGAALQLGAGELVAGTT
jgi:hypothetical protein